MGEHTEDMAKSWNISREAQDELALRSHQNAITAQDRGFFTDLILPVDGVTTDSFPRRDTSMEKLTKLKPAFDRTSGRATLTAGNSSPLTDGAAAIWVATTEGLPRLSEPLCERAWSISKWRRSTFSMKACSWPPCPPSHACLRAGD